MSQRTQMLAGEWYDSRDPELLAAAARARRLLATIAALDPADAATRAARFAELFGALGDGAWIETPFACEYGAQIRIGRDTFVNVQCVFQDCAEITIGDGGLIGPNVQIYTASHPLEAGRRIIPVEERTPGVSPYRTRAQQVTIGDRVWIGGGTIILPGVTIGDDVTIGAGSIVTRDVPSGVLAMGQPCRVVRNISAP